eukprot:jgi/Mesvir1/15947/Mv08265-RA.1
MAFRQAARAAMACAARRATKTLYRVVSTDVCSVKQGNAFEDFSSHRAVSSFISQPKLRSHIDVRSSPAHTRKTAIICTIGPASEDEVNLPKVLDAGMDVMRLNFSHADHQVHGNRIRLLRRILASRREAKGGSVLSGRDICAIAVDLKGPEIRTGVHAVGDVQKISLQKGQRFTLHMDKSWDGRGDTTGVYCDYANMPNVMAVGGYIYVDDGLLRLQVVELAKDRVVCEVMNSAMLGSKKGINLPDCPVDLPVMSDKDKADLRFAVENEADFIFASFIRCAQDVHGMRDFLRSVGPHGEHIKIISKIENHQGVENFDEILEASDGVMVARGDMGVELPPEKVPFLQKSMVSKANRAGKPVVVATQMLETMTKNPRATRAEVNDVANAILDGADGVMLSGETAAGSFPVQAVELMSGICHEAEAMIHPHSLFTAISRNVGPSGADEAGVKEAIGLAAVRMSYEDVAKALVVPATTGDTARLVAKYRPDVPLLVPTCDPLVARNLKLARSIQPILLMGEAASQVQRAAPGDRGLVMARHALGVAVQSGALASGDTVLAVVRVHDTIPNKTLLSMHAP